MRNHIQQTTSMNIKAIGKGIPVRNWRIRHAPKVTTVGTHAHETCGEWLEWLRRNYLSR